MSTLPITNDPLIFWMDPAEKFITRNYSTLNVSSVANRLDGNLITQPTTSKQPGWNATAINGLPGLVFNGAQCLNYNYIAQLLTNKQPFTISQVFNNFSGNGVFLFIGAFAGGNVGYTSIESQSSGFFIDYEDNVGGASYHRSNYLTLTTGAYIATSIFDGTTLRARLNYTDLSMITGSALGTASFSVMQIGCATVNGSEVVYATCNIGDTIILKGSNDYLIVEGYLKEKYGI